MRRTCFTLSLILAGFLVLWSGGFLALRSADRNPNTALPPDGEDGRELALDQFRPKSMLNVPEHLLTAAKFHVVDAHTHPLIRMHGSVDALRDYVRLMDQHNIAVSVSLDGGMKDAFDEHKKYLWTDYQDRFVILANIDWRGQGQADKPETWDCQRPDFGRRTATELARLKKEGASGLKVFKDLGLIYRNPDGTFIRVDDPRWDPIWAACGELQMPVLIHTADPVAFFLPIDRFNERWEELKRHPDWSFARPGYPAYEELIGQFIHIVERHPQTKFIGAHVAGSAEDLGRVSQWLDKYSNLYVDIAARIGELGRQPYTAREFFLKYSRAVLIPSFYVRFREGRPRAARRPTVMALIF